MPCYFNIIKNVVHAMVLLLPSVMSVFVSRVLPVLLAIFLCWQGAAIPVVQATLNSTTVSSVNSSSSPEDKTAVDGTMESPTNTKGLLERSLYVAVGLSAIVAIYFIIRTIKTRGKRKTKRYGVIHGAADMEMQPLDKHVDEEEEDVTVFDVNTRKQPIK